MLYTGGCCPHFSNEDDERLSPTARGFFENNTDEFDRVLREIYEGNAGIVDSVLARKYGEFFLSGFTGKYGFDLMPNEGFKAAISENLADFGAFKAYAQQFDLKQLLVDENGVVRSFSEFRRVAMPVVETYNKQWLYAEYNTTVASAQMARNWHRYEEEAELFPILEFVTSNDDRVRPAHRVLNGIKRKITDAFWRTHYPPLGFGCRCRVGQHDDSAKVTDRVDMMRKVRDANVPIEWQNNVGISGQVFTDKHPYVPSNRQVREQIIKEVAGGNEA